MFAAIAKQEARRWYLVRRTEWGLVAFIALLAGLASFLYFGYFRDFYNNDSPTYITPAVNLAAGKGFTDGNGNPEIMRTPDVSFT